MNLAWYKRLVELGSILEPAGKHPKRNKASILIDAVQTVTQLRSEVQKLSESNEDLKEKIKELEVLSFGIIYTSCFIKVH